MKNAKLQSFPGKDRMLRDWMEMSQLEGREKPEFVDWEKMSWLDGEDSEWLEKENQLELLKEKQVEWF